MEKSLERESDQYRWSWLRQAVRKSNIKAVRMVGIVRRGADTQVLSLGGYRTEETDLSWPGRWWGPQVEVRLAFRFGLVSP